MSVDTKSPQGPPVVLIAGPTASGKSGLAQALARRTGGVIINADSMQVYRELRILTARPSAEEEAEIPHRLYGIVSVREAFSVGRWVAAAAAALADAKTSGQPAIVVGGTGLYFEALTRGLAEIPPVPEAIRAEIRARLAQSGAPALHAELSRRDPLMAARLRPSDPQRIARALEVLEATGRSLATYQSEKVAPVLGRGWTGIVLAPPRAELYARIDERFSAMLAAGALEEVGALRASGPCSSTATRALGVRPLLAVLDGQMTLEEAVFKARTTSRHYAKRQLTWLRHRMIAWKWLETKYSERDLDEILSFMAEKN